MAAKKTTAKNALKKTVPPKRAAVPSAAADESTLASSRTAWIALGIFILVCAAVILFLNRPAPNYDYNAYPFTKSSCPGTDKPCYFATLTINNQPYTIPFYYHPKDVQNISFQYDALDTLRAAYQQGNATIVIGVPDGAPGEIAIAGTELSRVLGKRYGILNFDVVARVIGTGPDQIDCNRASPTVVVIGYQQGTEDGIFLQAPNCIVLSATSSQRAIAVSDAFVYRLLGVIRTMKPGAAPAPDAAPVPTNITIAPNTTR